MASNGGLYRMAGIGEVAANVRTNYTAPCHTHDTYSIGIFKGPARIWCRGAMWDVDAGTIAVLEPGEPHRGTPLSRTCAQDMILPEAAFMIRSFGSARPFRISRHLIADPALARSLSRAAADRDAGALRGLLCRLFTVHGTPATPRAAAVGRAGAAMLGADLGAGIAAASRAQGVSRSHFSRTLRALTGLSPRDMRRQLRVARARAMIEGGEDLASAALGSGFADQAHMTRQLRSLLGVTPSALRRGKREE
ncbi:MAG TPA: helix-turn-helix transcriptional regulator [Allosphingosinicella sp.]|nr:helix-turn-helix transcriptional regulator [Allosphingosinicella sp.]